MSDVIKEFTISVQPHDLLHADCLRLICDRFGLIVLDPLNEDGTPIELEDAANIEIGFLMGVEAYSGGTMIARKEYSGAYTRAGNPRDILIGIALSLFPNSSGEPMKLKESEDI
jgi:hypothetical protein